MGHQIEWSLGDMARGNIEPDSFRPLLQHQGAVCGLPDTSSAAGQSEDSRLMIGLLPASEAAFSPVSS